MLEYSKGKGRENGGFTMKDYTNQVQVGFDGDDAYIQGFAPICPELWVKATQNEAGQYVIPANQFMGTYDVGEGFFYLNFYFTAVDEEGNLTDLVLNYDAETQTFSTDQMMALNRNRKVLDYYYLYSGVTITKMQEVAATPADPSVMSFNGKNRYVMFDIPIVDVDGNDLIWSKLSYVIWIEKDGVEQPLTLEASLYEALEEDMTEIPYLFDGDGEIFVGGMYVLLNQDPDEIKTWTKIGVQSIYRGLGEENKSNIGWFDLETTGIASVKTDEKNSVIFDLQGRRVTQPSKGLYIVDGRKVMFK